MAYKRILIISDLHIPYHHKDSIEFLREIKKQYKPDKIVNIGDLLDFHAINMHTHDPDLYSAGHELKQSKIYIRELESIFPKMDERLMFFAYFLKCVLFFSQKLRLVCFHSWLQVCL